MIDRILFRLAHSRYAHLWTEYGAEAVAADVGPVILLLLAAVTALIMMVRP